MFQIGDHGHDDTHRQCRGPHGGRRGRRGRHRDERRRDEQHSMSITTTTKH